MRRIARPIVQRLTKPFKALLACAKYVSRRAPLDPIPSYEEYWKRRERDGTSGTFYPRFEIVGSMVQPEESVLDFGCGSGELLKYLRNKGFKKLAGCDVCKPEGYPKTLPFYTIDELLRNERFDVVVMLQVIEHIPDAEESIAKMFTVSNKVIISIPNSGYWQHRLRLLFGRVPITDVLYHMKEHVRLWTHKDFLDMCKHHGWNVQMAKATVPKNGVLPKLFPGLFARQIIYLLENRQN